jgi:2-methylisocitrate lyase-like PEP mutase family enzyme
MMQVMSAQHERGAAFRALHAGEPFVIPNPWDAGSARVLEGLGFRALATTSSGLAFTRGRPDGGVGFDDVLAHVRLLAEATELPITVDLEHGFGATPEEVGAAIEAVAAAGAVGASVEDYSSAEGIMDVGRAAERVAAAVEAAGRLGFPFVVTARAENQWRGGVGLDDTIARLQTYEQAGADVVYAPALWTVDEVRAVCAAATVPVNVLAHAGLSMDEIVAAGGQRVSVGGALTWVAARALVEAATAIRDSGDFSVLATPGPPSWLR